MATQSNHPVKKVVFYGRTLIYLFHYRNSQKIHALRILKFNKCTFVQGRHKNHAIAGGKALGLLHRWHGDGSLCVGYVGFSPQLRNSLRLGVELDALFAVAVKSEALVSKILRESFEYHNFTEQMGHFL